MKIKLLTNLLTLSALLCASAADVPASIKDYFAKDTFVQGAQVRAQLGEDFQKASAVIEAAVKTAPKEALDELQKAAKPDEPIPFIAKLGFTKEQHDAYLKAWENRKMVPQEVVAARLEEGKDNNWKIKVLSVNGGNPLPMSNLEYNAEKDEWTSPNGKLTRKEDVNFSKDNIFRAWSGPQWQFEKKDDMGTVVETFATGKSPDGKNIFLVYRLIELAANGRPTWQNMYILNFPSDNMKSDPLKDAAKKRAADKADKK